MPFLVESSKRYRKKDRKKGKITRKNVSETTEILNSNTKIAPIRTKTAIKSLEWQKP